MKLSELKEIVDRCREHFGIIYPIRFSCDECGVFIMDVHIPEAEEDNLSVVRKVHSYLKEEIIDKKVPVEIMRNEAGVVI